MTRRRDAGDAHDEEVRKFDEASDKCDDCGRKAYGGDLAAWDTADGQRAHEHSEPEDVVWVCRSCLERQQKPLLNDACPTCGKPLHGRAFCDRCQE